MPGSSKQIDAKKKKQEKAKKKVHCLIAFILFKCYVQ